MQIRSVGGVAVVTVHVLLFLLLLLFVVVVVVVVVNLTHSIDDVLCTSGPY